MYVHIIKYCHVYFCVAFSRVLRIMTQNESCDIRQLYVVELAVGSEQKLYYFCYELSSQTSTGSTSLTIKFSRVFESFIAENKLVETAQ